MVPVTNCCDTAAPAGVPAPVTGSPVVAPGSITTFDPSYSVPSTTPNTLTVPGAVDTEVAKPILTPEPVLPREDAGTGAKNREESGPKLNPVDRPGPTANGKFKRFSRVPAMALN